MPNIPLTAKDVIDQLEKAKQKHRDLLIADPRFFGYPNIQPQFNLSHAIDAGAYAASVRKAEAQKMNPMAMISMRMKWRTSEGEPLNHPFDFMTAHVTEDVAAVFIVAKGKPVTIEDDVGLFPSDALITQLHLLQG